MFRTSFTVFTNSPEWPLDYEKMNKIFGGGRGIRTHETFLPTGFQDQLHRPLGQTSA